MPLASFAVGGASSSFALNFFLLLSFELFGLFPKLQRDVFQPGSAL